MKKPAFLGGEPLSKQPLQIVRPNFFDFSNSLEDFQESLRNGVVTNHGPHVQEFEVHLRDYLEVTTIACNSGQSALMLMLRAAGIDEGEVIVPSFTFSATPHAVKWVGATPVFADIRSDDLTLDPEEVEKCITNRTVAVMGVDVYGIPCHYDEFEALGRKHNLKILYDSAPAFGSKFDGKLIGGYGDAQSFSFHATKSFTTMEGGALSSRDEGLLERARNLRNFGQRGGADCAEPGINAKMTEVCGLMGLQQLKSFDKALRRRKHIAELYTEGLREIPGLVLPQRRKNTEPVWLYFPVRVIMDEFGLDRDSLAKVLVFENLHVRKYFELPCHHMFAYKEHEAVHLPVTDLWGYNTISLPVYNDMTDDECSYFIDAIKCIHEFSPKIRENLANQ